MKYEIGNTGRVVVARLEEGDDVYKSLEGLCQTEKIEQAVFWIIGGNKNVELVSGPADITVLPLKVITNKLDEIQEILGTGTVFPDKDNNPKIHMHASFGHDKDTITGCPRINLDCWLINEVVLMEITGISAKRLPHPTGFDLLTLGQQQNSPSD